MNCRIDEDSWCSAAVLARAGRRFVQLGAKPRTANGCTEVGRATGGFERGMQARSTLCQARQRKEAPRGLCLSRRKSQRLLRLRGAAAEVVLLADLDAAVAQQ